MTRRVAMKTGLGTALSTVSLSGLRADDGPLFGIVEGAEDFWIATDAYIYGYPLVTVEMTRRVITNKSHVEGARGPMGQIISLRKYPNASCRDVTAPNADTLYSTGFFYLDKEPWVLSIPDMKGRYALFPMLDGWTTVFAVPGKRTTGTEAQTYAITGPNWSDALQDGVKELKSPTNIVWLIGRVYCTGTPADYAAVHGLLGSLQASAVEFLWQRVHASAVDSRSINRHEDAGARPSQSHGCGRLLHALGTVDEGQSAHSGGCCRSCALRQDRTCARPRLRRE